MPHIIVEYSANLEPEMSIQDLVDALHETALATGVFPIGGLRTRAARRDIYAVADRAPENGFVAVIARVGHGRDIAIRQRVAADLMRTLTDATAPVFARRGLGLTVEVQEIDPAMSLKLNNLHERIAARAEEDRS